MEETGKRRDDTVLREEIFPMIQGMGYQIVEFEWQRTRAGIRIYLVIYREGGISMDDTSGVYRAVYPRMEILFDTRDIHLEISSPGVSRRIKGTHEYDIFAGRRIKVLPMDSSEWYKGTNRGVQNGKLELDVDGEMIDIPISNIKKAQLLFEWGNGEKK